jgi:hypothetical protein
MKFVVTLLLAGTAIAKVVHEEKRKSFKRSPFETYDRSVTNIVYDKKGFSTRLT